MAKKSSSHLKKVESKEAKPGLRYERCKTLAFMVLPPDDSITSGELEFSVGTGLSGDLETDNKIILTVDVTGGLVGAEDRSTVISIVTASEFAVSNIGSMPRNAEGSMVIPGWMMATIVTTAIGATRGILVEKLASTIYSGVLMPIYNLSELLPPKAHDAVLGLGI